MIAAASHNTPNETPIPMPIFAGRESPWSIEEEDVASVVDATVVEVASVLDATGVEVKVLVIVAMTVVAKLYEVGGGSFVYRLDTPNSTLVMLLPYSWPSDIKGTSMKTQPLSTYPARVAVQTKL